MGHATALNHLNPTVPLVIVEAFNISQPSVNHKSTISQPSVNYQSTISQLNQPYFDGCLMLFFDLSSLEPSILHGNFLCHDLNAPPRQ